MNHINEHLIKRTFNIATLAISFLIAVQSAAQVSEKDESLSFEFSSSERRTDTLVLFTSEGCSSCPPAEKWLNSYSTDPDLWKDRIPLAFHVDYWDYLGWKDPFAKKAFSTLQRDYARQGHFASVYTPGIAVNNNEFRQWFYGQRAWQPATEKPGVLKVEVEGDVFQVGFDSNEQLSDTEFEVHSAWLGMDITTKVTAGENAGRNLRHDFVVLDYKNYGESMNRNLKLSPIPEVGQSSSVMVVWVTRPNSVEILQSVAYPI